MKIEDLFCDDWYNRLNAANDAMEPYINLINGLVPDEDYVRINEAIKRIEKEMQPVADKLRLDFKLRMFLFPSILHRKKGNDTGKLCE